MRTVIFDLDGTLISSHEDVWLCLEQALEPFRLSIPGQIRGDNCILLKTAGEILKMVYPEATAADCERYSQDVHRLYAQECKFEHTFVYPGIPELLEQLSRCGTRLLVVTMKPEVSARIVLQVKGILPFFTGVYSPDSFPPEILKKAEIFQRIKAQYGLQDGTCIAVGDQPADVLAASAAELPTAAAAWGYGEYELLVQSQPAVILSNATELLKYFMEIGFCWFSSSPISTNRPTDK